jgi:hypothetical protein
VKLKVKTENKYNEKRKILNIFQNSKWKQEYTTEINNRFEILESMEDEDNTDNNIKGKWENIKTLLKETKLQLIERDESTETKNIWYDEECKIAIKEIKTARERWLIKGKRENEKQKYHNKRKEAHKIIRNKKSYTLKM